MTKYESGHITDESIKALHEDTLDDARKIEMLNHLSTCDYCMSRYISYMEDDLIAPPSNFSEEIIAKTRTIPNAIQSARIKFYRYCIRVTLGMAASLFLILSSNFIKLDQIKLTPPNAQFKIFDTIDQQLNSISEKIKFMEDYRYDKEKK